MFQFMFYILGLMPVFGLCDQNALQGKLVFAQIVFRHGDRTPVETYPTDPWRDLKYWPTGWGQLTNTGKEQHYELGQWLRQRYSMILNNTYSKDSVFVLSTDVDRTLMSALSNLAGLYPPEGKQVWNTNVNWQPIPVHTIPEKMDAVLAGKKACPAYDYAMSKLKNSEEFKELDRRFKPLYNYLTNHTGKNINSLEAVQRIYNTLWIEDLYNKTLPEWTEKVYPDGDMEWISKRSFATSTYTRKLARLKCGLLLKEVLDRFSTKYHSKLKPNRSLWIYSAHDTTVANLLNTLKLFEYHSPPYRACILLEMRILDDNPYISIFYKNTSSEPMPLDIPGCGKFCHLNDMFKLYNDVLPIDWESECKLSMLSMTYEEADVGDATAILVVIAGAILLVIILYAIIMYYRRKSYFDYRWYVQIDN